MNRWNTVQEFAMEIAKLEKSSGFEKELNIAQCSIVAKNVKNLYKNGGKDSAVGNIRSTLPYHMSKNGFTIGQKQNVEAIIKELFKYHWFPVSRIRVNMARIGATK